MIHILSGSYYFLFQCAWESKRYQVDAQLTSNIARRTHEMVLTMLTWTMGCKLMHFNYKVITRGIPWTFLYYPSYLRHVIQILIFNCISYVVCSINVWHLSLMIKIFLFFFIKKQKNYAISSECYVMKRAKYIKLRISDTGGYDIFSV